MLLTLNTTRKKLKLKSHRWKPRGENTVLDVVCASVNW